MNPKTVVDFEGLGVLVKGFRTSQKLDLRAAAKASGVSASTLSRIERGEARPDLDTVKLLVDWVGVPLEKVISSPKEKGAKKPVAQKAADPFGSVEVQFRADPNLTPKAAEAIITIMKAAYEELAKKREGK